MSAGEPAGTAATLTVFRKIGGPLTKRIRLDPNGAVVSDGSACVMAHGEAERIHLADITKLAMLIDTFEPEQALALGALQPELPDRCEVVTKRKLADLNGKPSPHLIARTAEAIRYEAGRPAYALLDFDAKGMPTTVREQIRAAGSFWKALICVLPALKDVAHVERLSTSAGLFRTDTNEQLPGSGGVHIYLAVQDGSDIPRFLTTLHELCWLAGFGWGMAGAGGQFLERSIVDRMVGAPERLVFEGPPVLDPPLAQDRNRRRPVVHPGGALDTTAVTLTLVKRSKLKFLLDGERHRLKPELEKARRAFIDEQVKRLIDRTGMARSRAEQVIAQQCKGVLLPQFVLPFDDDEFAGATVADVLADPAKFEGATLADPLEGPDYGRCKAKVIRRDDGTVWINSFAHGRTVYELKLDAAAVRVAIDGGPPSQVVDIFIRAALDAVLDPAEEDALLAHVSARSRTGKRVIGQMLKAAREQRQEERRRKEREKKAAERHDPRPQIGVPGHDAPWLPQMAIINEVLSGSRAAEPPMRDLYGYVVQVRNRRVPGMHLLTAAGANQEEPDDTRLPAPEQPLLEQLDEVHVAETIERHIDYVDREGRSVHLPAAFVKHYLCRPADEALPIVYGVVTLPMVLPTGALLSGGGLNRDHCLVFRVPPELLLPRREECGPGAIAEAMRFLTDEWLVDVATTYQGKCVLIAATLTVIERYLFPERPIFLASSGRRGGGKTTTLSMAVVAATGVRPAAETWSTDEEERRKALFALHRAGLPVIVWDNIPRGTMIDCPHIARATTTPEHGDRVLGESKRETVPATSIQFFTGNNVGFGGDLLSRGLQMRIEVERPDPENRPFRHPDPIGWTEINRGEILQALYMILLANPGVGRASDADTRFKMWWHLVGGAVEYAAACHVEHVNGMAMDVLVGCQPELISFRKMFLSQEEIDEETVDLGEALSALNGEWPRGETFKAAQVAKLINERQNEFWGESKRQRGEILREFLCPRLPPAQVVTAKKVSGQLRKHLGNPVRRGDQTLILKAVMDPSAETFDFCVSSG